MSTPMSAVRSAGAVLEAAVLTAGVPLVGWWLDRREAFYLGCGFSWLVFVPLLVGLRHGSTLGCASALIADTAMVLAWRARALGVTAFPGETVVALVATAMLVGQFSDVWRRENGRLQAELASASRRLDEVSRARSLLELSHDRVDERTRNRPSLRQALDAVRRVAAGRQGMSEALGGDILNVFAAYCSIDAGSLHLVNALNEVEPRPIAAVGRSRSVLPSDALVLQALATRRITYLASEAAISAEVPSELLAVVPLVDETGAARALLCVESLPFMAFHQRNLETMAILARHFADVVFPMGRAAPDEGRASASAPFSVPEGQGDEKGLDAPLLG
jgi:hypothetical protein